MKLFINIFFILILTNIIIIILIKKQRSKNNILLFQENDFEKQKNIITEQNKKIKYQNQQLNSSITCAERIQKAILPSGVILNKILKDYFIFYKPKDIVSGDFYWVYKIKNKIILAIADCTGHGIPGAFMSILGISFLNDIISKQKIIASDKILNKLRNKIIKTLNQQGSTQELYEGMDISLIIINEDTLNLEFSGSFISCYIIRNNEIYELKADFIPIGKFINKKNKLFNRSFFQLKKGDTIYSFSDGFKDQFGGIERKKIKINRLKELLLKVQDKTMLEQRIYLELYFNYWKQNFEQTDDVMIIGIKI